MWPLLHINVYDSIYRAMSIFTDYTGFNDSWQDAKIVGVQTALQPKTGHRVELSAEMKRALEGKDGETDGLVRVLHELRNNNVLFESANNKQTSKIMLQWATSFMDRRFGAAMGQLVGIHGAIAGPVVKLLYGLMMNSKDSDSGTTTEWGKLMQLLNIDRHVEAFVDDNVECEFLLKYLPSMMTRRTKFIKKKKKNVRKMETIEEQAERIRSEAPTLFRKFLCANYGIKLVPCV
jgi:hypothetical protein